jgi:hypothetical protein
MRRRREAQLKLHLRNAVHAYASMRRRVIRLSNELADAQLVLAYVHRVMTANPEDRHHEVERLLKAYREWLS